MIIAIAFCIFVLATCSPLQRRPNLERYNVKSGSGTDVFSGWERRKRSMYSIGVAAMKALKTGARKLFATEFGEVFVKGGGYQQGRMDFYSVSPTNVRYITKKGGTVRKMGTVGNLKIILDEGNQGYPAKLTIQTTKLFPDTNSFVKDTILYDDAVLKNKVYLQ